MINITACSELRKLTRLEILNQYLLTAQLNPNKNKLYIQDLEASIEQEKKTPTKDYTQECFGVIVQGVVKQDYRKP